MSPKHMLRGMLVVRTVLVGSQMFGQTAYYDHTVQDSTWTSGTHHTSVTQKIISPGVPYLPTTISGTADAEFVSGTGVRLKDGFHAGAFTGGGRFRARIDAGLGPDGDVVVVTPDSATHVTDQVMHVEKWEKLEVGLQLPLAYRDAIDRFFANYYANGVTNDATPDSVDAIHDLNPYADDSLQLVMQLTSPSGAQTMKWGFFMRESKWASTSPTALLAEDTTDPLHPYTIRFRFAPGEEGTWQFALSVKAPHTVTLANAALPPLHYTGYSFVCDPPLADNHGFLAVNPVNRQTLQFDDGTSFFGLGTNMADMVHNPANWYLFYQSDFETMQRTMGQLHSVGGNFLRMYLMRHVFAPEWINAGVYDYYHAESPCTGPPGFSYASSCQYQCWAFDRMLDHARDNDLYIQLCIDPYPPIIDYENYIWGSHPYVIHYLEPQRDPVTGRFDLKKFFYKGGDTANTDGGVFYHWKRKYKYMMARWGYSVNLAAMEPFNEIDQMLTYQDRDLTNAPNNTTCPENKIDWPADPELPGTISQWLTDLTEYIRDPVNLADPVGSPLGESNKLFLMSYTDVAAPSNTTHHLPFTNPVVDLIDAHRGLGSGEDAVKNTFDIAQAYKNIYDKPFHHGEYTTYGEQPYGSGTYGTYGIFDNYDVSFHNELWASAFFGNFSVGTSWGWTRVFWWPGALLQPPTESPAQNPHQTVHSNALGATNVLNVGGLATPVENRTVYHNFKPLSDLLTNPNWQALDFFNGDFDPHKVVDNTNKIECYYLMDTARTMAIGWVHNLNARWENHYYIKNSPALQNFLGCSPPTAQQISLPGFGTGLDYFITYFPTRMNDTIHPADAVDTSGTGAVLLDLSTAALGDTANRYLDTLHVDYAFIIALQPVPKSMSWLTVADTIAASTDWDFSLFPNPARDVLNVVLQGDQPKNISLYDLSGREILSRGNVTSPSLRISLDPLSSGPYFVRVSDAIATKMKILLIR